ncbi:MAG: hypothetical protein H7A43_12225 [Verrucomicrobia bacterium]|nr:hypothetical protein [Verrucomicrobiota bacterium]
MKTMILTFCLSLSVQVRATYAQYNQRVPGTREDPAPMMAYIASTEPPLGQSVAEWHRRKNHYLGQLTTSSADIQGTVEQLLQIVEGSETDAITRDYILQHLQLHAMQRLSSVMRDRVNQVLWRMTDGPGKTTAGTALLALKREATERPDISRESVAFKAREVSLKPSAPGASAGTALEVLHVLDPDAGIQTARSIQQRGTSDQTSIVSANRILSTIDPEFQNCKECP